MDPFKRLHGLPKPFFIRTLLTLIPFLALVSLNSFPGFNTTATSDPLVNKNTAESLNLGSSGDPSIFMRKTSTGNECICNLTHPEHEIQSNLSSYNQSDYEVEVSPLINDDANMKVKVGQGTWAFLHYRAVLWPEFHNKTEEDQFRRDLYEFIMLLPKVYPCQECAKHMDTIFREYPPNLRSGDEFGEWLCFVHNIVNQRLGKKHFDCTTWKEKWKPQTDCEYTCRVAAEKAQVTVHSNSTIEDIDPAILIPVQLSTDANRTGLHYNQTDKSPPSST